MPKPYIDTKPKYEDDPHKRPNTYRKVRPYLDFNIRSAEPIKTSSDKQTAPYNTGLAKQSRFQNLKAKLLVPKDKEWGDPSNGIPAEEFNSLKLTEKDITDSGIISGNNYLEGIDGKYEDGTLHATEGRRVYVRPRSTSGQPYWMGTAKDPLTATVQQISQLPVAKFGQKPPVTQASDNRMTFTVDDAINAALLAYGGVEVLKAGKGIFDKALAKSYIERLNRTKGLNLSPDEVDLATIKVQNAAQTMKKNPQASSWAEFKRVFAGQRGSGELMPLPENKPVSPEIAKAAQSAGQKITPALTNLVGKTYYRGESGIENKQRKNIDFYTSEESYASKFGKTSQSTITPKNPLIIDFSLTFEKLGASQTQLTKLLGNKEDNISSYLAVAGAKGKPAVDDYIAALAKAQGYDSIVIPNYSPPGSKTPTGEWIGVLDKSIVTPSSPMAASTSVQTELQSVIKAVEESRKGESSKRVSKAALKKEKAESEQQQMLADIHQRALEAEKLSQPSVSAPTQGVTPPVPPEQISTPPVQPQAVQPLSTNEPHIDNIPSVPDATIPPTGNVPPAPPTVPPSQSPVPPLPPNVVAPVSQPSLPQNRYVMPPIQDGRTILNIATNPDFKRSIANLPVFKQIMNAVNPSATANTPAEKFATIRAVAIEQGRQRTQIVMSHLLKQGDASKVFGTMNEEGVIKSGTFTGLTVNEIAEKYDTHYPNLTESQRTWLNTAKEIEDAALEFANKNGIAIEELYIPVGQRFATRKVVTKKDVNGDLMEVAFVGSGPGRVGGKISSQKHRVFKTVAEARAEGFVYAPYDQALELKIQSIYKSVANKEAADWLLAEVPWRTTGAPDELVLAAEQALRRTKASSGLLNVLNRGIRGKRVPPNTIMAHGRTYPTLAREVQNLLPRIQSGEPTANAVQDLTRRLKALNLVDARALKEAVNARARAREKSMTLRYGEASLQHPAFQGKIFTGDDAKKLVQELRNYLEPRTIEALDKLNTVNAMARYFTLAGDASLFGVQLLVSSFSNPKAYARAFGAYWRSIFDTEFHANLLEKKAVILAKYPDFITSLKGMEMTETFGKQGLLNPKKPLLTPITSTGNALGQAATLAPRAILKGMANILDPFARATNAGLDAAGITILESMDKMNRLDKDAHDIAQFANEIRGMTNSAALGTSQNERNIESIIMLAPRYNRAIASFLSDAFEGFATGGGASLRSKAARNSLIIFMGGFTLLWIAFGLTLGKSKEEIKDSITQGLYTYDIGGVNIGPGTKMRSIAKAVVDSAKDPESMVQASMDNPLLRFIRGNLSPVAGNSIDVLTGKNYIGDPVRDNWRNIGKELVAGNLLPIWVENLAMEGGNPWQLLIRGSSEFFGGRTYPETDYQTLNNMRDRYAAMDKGSKWADLNNEQRDAIRSIHSDLVEAEAHYTEVSLPKKNEDEQFIATWQKKLFDVKATALETAAVAYYSGKATKKDYDKQRSYIRPWYSGGTEVLYALKEAGMSEYELNKYQKYMESRKPEDIALNEYQIFKGDTIETANFPTDWDLVDKELAEFLGKYPQEIQDYIIRNENSSINDLPENAKRLELERVSGIEDGSWWDNYNGNSTSTYTPRIKRSTTTPARTFKDVLGFGQPQTDNSFTPKKRTFRDVLK